MASVDLPDPFGPIRAWSSPARTVVRDAVEDLLVVDRDVEVVDLEHGSRCRAGRVGGRRSVRDLGHVEQSTGLGAE